jgi:uncharacterized protein
MKEKSEQSHSGEKIDIFCHLVTPKFKENLLKKVTGVCYYMDNLKRMAALGDLNLRLRHMDLYEGYKQVLSIGVPPVELVLPPKDAAELSRIANDEMAELLNKYPDRFVAAVACIPMNDVDAAIAETERAIEDLKFKGVQIYSSIGRSRKPLDRPEFLPLYAKIAQYDVPIFLHPVRDKDVPDYPDEKLAKYSAYVQFAWPFETTMALTRLVRSGVMEKYPNLKTVVHHCGAMLPFFAGRIGLGVPEPGEIAELTKPPLEYYKKFFGDTVLGGNTPALMCGYSFFGPDHMVFASDYPYPGGPNCDAALGGVIQSVEKMSIPAEEKTKIFSTNARKLLKL